MNLKQLLTAAVRFSGLPWLIRQTYAANKATILLYHDPTPEEFERHLAYLSKRYQLIPLSLLVDAIHAKDWSAVPRRALVITIDDGHRGNARLGEVCRKYGARPTIYLCSQIVGTLRHFWFKEAPEDALQDYKRLTNDERLRALEDVGYSRTREYSESERQALSREEIEELKDWADVGSHGRFHPILTTCSGPECELEIRQSRRELEELTGLACDQFCYPNGDYTQREVDLLQQADYRSARSCDGGWNDLRTDPYRLKVTGVTDDADLNKLAVQLTGLVEWMLWKRAGGGWRAVKPPITIEETASQRFASQA